MAISKIDHGNPWSKPWVWSKVKVKFDLENSKVKVMAEVKVKRIGHIWGLEFNRCVCSYFWWQSEHFWLRYSNFHIWPWKFKVKVMAKVKIWWSYLRPEAQSIRLLFVTWQSDHFVAEIIPYFTLKINGQGHTNPMVTFRYVCFSFRGNGPIWLRYSKFHIWPWKFKVKVMTKFDQNLIR